jgi:hypothetical protein
MKFPLFLFFIVLAHIAYGQSIININCSKDVFTQTQINDKIIYQFIIIPTLNSTWCYDIFKNNKLFIHQTSIPGLPGNEGFKNKSDAEKVARLVIEKLRKGEMPPSVTKEELIKLKVL